MASSNSTAEKGTNMSKKKKPSGLNFSGHKPSNSGSSPNVDEVVKRIRDIFQPHVNKWMKLLSDLKKFQGEPQMLIILTNGYLEIIVNALIEAHFPNSK